MKRREISLLITWNHFKPAIVWSIRAAADEEQGVGYTAYLSSKTKLYCLFCHAPIRILARPCLILSSAIPAHLPGSFRDLHLSIMPALEEAQGRPDKLQSAPGVNLVREGLELFTAFKSFKNSCLADEIGFSADASHTKQTQ